MPEMKPEVVIAEVVGMVLKSEQPAALARQREAAAEDIARAQTYAANARSPNTVRVYQALWRVFEEWCAATGAQPLPASPEAVAAFLAYRADEGASAQTIKSSVAALAWKHRDAGFPLDTRHPAVLATKEGIMRKVGTAQAGKAPVSDIELRRMLAVPGLSKRERAVLLLGWAGAFRRSELVQLKVFAGSPVDSSIAIDAAGIHVRLGKTKTDQTGQGFYKFIPRATDPALCPVAATETWMKLRTKRFPTSAWLFPRNSDPSQPMAADRVAAVVKRAAELAGFDAEAVRNFSGHSLRAGFVTTARRAGWTDQEIMARTAHTKAETLSIYDRRSQAEKVAKLKPLI